jgi:protein SCO1/2
VSSARAWRAAGAIAALLLLSGVARAATQPAPAFRAGVFDPPRAAPEFELPGSTGSPVKLSQYRGKVIALAFGFTYCPRICPVTLANLAKTFEKLGPDASQVQVVFVSVDPERDTPARMHEFLDFFNPAFVGVTGTPKQLEAVRREFGISAEKVISQNKQLGYEVHHSSFVYLIDRQGRLRLLMPFGKSADDLAHDVALLLKE